MKTYKKTIEKPLLEITNEEDPENPREWSNLGYFITIESDNYSPDNNDELHKIIKNTGKEATSQEKHIEMITEQYQEETGYHIEAIYPITKYKHGGTIYKLGQYHGFDYSNNGFYIITTETQKELGTKKKDFEKVINQELEVYNQFINGETYRFILYDKKGEHEDSCGGFYNIEHIREHLPKEWKKEDLTNYIIN